MEDERGMRVVEAEGIEVRKEMRDGKEMEEE